MLGDFDDAVFGEGDARTRFFRRGDRYLVQTAGRDGRAALFEVPFVFGVEPLQQLLVRLPGGRLQAFPVAWDSRAEHEGGQRWFHLTPDDPPRPGDPFHWTGVYQTWNHQCASCHSTAVARGYDAATDTYETTWVEIDVGCQACHGGGAAHVAGARGEGPRTRLRRIQPERELDVCGPCHALRSELTADAVPGGPFFDHYDLALPTPPLYFADGRIREEVYVTGSFLQSRMHAAGVACGDCHEPHRGTLRRDGNALCLGCHGPAAPERFATAAPAGRDYDSAAHHGHAAGSAAAECVTCHMPERVYMGVDGRRDHAFRVPRPALDATTGAPSVCATCHADRAPGWAAEMIARWQGSTTGPEDADPASELAAASRPTLLRLAAGTRAPAIVRAAALERLVSLGGVPAERLAPLTRDPSPLVRTAAARAARAAASDGPVDPRPLLDPLLGDPVRAVRFEAARGLLAARAGAATHDVSARHDAVLAELVAVLENASDTPAALNRLGELAEARGQADPEDPYRAALRLDPGHEAAARHLARRHAARSDPAAAEAVLRDALSWNPQSAGLRFAHGLVLADLGREAEALAALEQAAAIAPERPRIQYNLGLLLQRRGALRRAEGAFLTGLRAAPDDADLIYALVAFHVNHGRRDDALRWARRLAEVRPGPDSERLVERLLEPER